MKMFVPKPVYRIVFIGGVFLVFFVPILFDLRNNLTRNGRVFMAGKKEAFSINSKYLVNTTRCKIPNVDPFDKRILKFYHPQKYYPCTKKPLLTYVTKIDNSATLHIDTDVVPSYTRNAISCCYANITRQENRNNPDDHIKITSCTDFKNNVTMREDFVVVECKDSKTKKKIYENTHATITVNNKVKKKMDAFNNNTINPFNVLFVGIDSISRLNLFRNLPTTHQFLIDNEWLPLEGYNKIGLNTFPNLMAILSGFNDSYAFATCEPKSLHKLDHCPLIWYDYRKLNYITAYAEDEAEYSTFNYLKKGFTTPPTDYYFRPYILGSQKLKTVIRDGMMYCTGPETSGERILNIAKDFLQTFRDYPTFSFFWMNTFSHNELNCPSGMDSKIRNFLEEVSSSGVVDNSFVIFLSDHGIRLGDIRLTSIGWLEERLPFIYLSVPERFKQQFPSEYENLKEKRHHLTNPYDLHMTLQHILILSGFNYTMNPSNACPKCKSFFLKTDLERSCEDAAIEQQWCTCKSFSPISKTDKIVKVAANYVTDQIHKIIGATQHYRKCAKFTVKTVIASSISEKFTYKKDIYLLLLIETRPKAFFEAMLLYFNDDNTDKFKLQGRISRLDLYNMHSRCTNDTELEKYCYCRHR